MWHIAIGCSMALVAAVASASESSLVRISTKDQQNTVSMAYGYCVGQRIMLDDILAANPRLRPRVQVFLLSWEQLFPGSCENLRASLEAHFLEVGGSDGAQAFLRVNQALSEGLTDSYSHFDYSLEGEALLADLEPRLQMSISSPVLEMLIAAVPQNVRNPQWEWSRGLTQAFDSTGHPKSRNISVMLRPPRSWVASEASRPNIVQRWKPLAGTSLDLYMLSIAPPVPELSAELAIAGASDAAEVCGVLAEESGTDGRLHWSDVTVLETQPAMRCRFTTKIQRLDQVTEFQSSVLVTAVNDHMIHLQAMRPVSGNAEVDRVEFDRMHSSLMSLANTLVIRDSYR